MSKSPKLKIEMLPVDALREYEGNARQHGETDVAAIKASIEQFGFNDPIGIWGENIIVEGHGRLMAAKDLGMTEVPCIRLDHLSEEERRAYALAHNKTAELSEWDWGGLKLELSGIEEIDMSSFGFNDGSEEEEKYQGQEESVEEETTPDARIVVAAVSLFGDDSEAFIVHKLSAELSDKIIKSLGNVSAEQIGQSVEKCLEEIVQ